MLQVAAGAARHGWDVHAAFPQTRGTASMVQECLAQGIHYHHVPLLPSKPTGLTLYTTLSLLKAVVPDVVQVTLGWPNEVYEFGLACGLLKIPALFVFQLVPEDLRLNSLLNLAAAWGRARNQQWAAVSKHNRYFLSKFCRIPQEQIPILYNGIETRMDLTESTPEQRNQIRRDVCREFGLPESCRLMLTVGRLSTQKGYFELLEAAGALVQDFPHVRFLWAGSGPKKNRLIRLVRKKGLEEYVLFLGYRSDIPRLLKAADLFVFPTRFEGGCSSSIREAMAHGLPIVSSGVSGIPEIVEHNHYGLLFSRGNIEEMLQSIRWALCHPDAMREMARNARRRIEEFSTERMVEGYIQAFERLIRQTPNWVP